jgi:hypothetical protein
MRRDAGTWNNIHGSLERRRRIIGENRRSEYPDSELNVSTVIWVDFWTAAPTAGVLALQRSHAEGGGKSDKYDSPSNKAGSYKVHTSHGPTSSRLAFWRASILIRTV